MFLGRGRLNFHRWIAHTRFHLIRIGNIAKSTKLNRDHLHKFLLLTTFCNNLGLYYQLPTWNLRRPSHRTFIWSRDGPTWLDIRPTNIQPDSEFDIRLDSGYAALHIFCRPDIRPDLKLYLILELEFEKPGNVLHPKFRHRCCLGILEEARYFGVDSIIPKLEEMVKLHNVPRLTTVERISDLGARPVIDQVPDTKYLAEHPA